MIGAVCYLRQCVMEVFCSTSTDRSKKSSSLLLTYNKSEDTKGLVVSHIQKDIFSVCFMKRWWSNKVYMHCKNAED